MGKTIRREVWVQVMGRHGPDDEVHERRRAQDLLDKAVCDNKELSHPKDDDPVEGQDGGPTDQPLQSPTAQPSSSQSTQPAKEDDSISSPPAPTPSFPPPPALPPPSTAPFGKAVPPSTQLRLRSSLAPSRPTQSDPLFTTQSSPTKRKQVRIWQDDAEKVPGVGSDKGSPQAKRAQAGLDGAPKRRRIDEGAVLSVGSSGAGRRVMSAEEAETRAADATRLAQGSIQRCVKYPYRHTDSPRPKTLNPALQKPSPICHSYHDPPVPPAQLPTPRGAPFDSSNNVKPGAFLFPNVLPYLAPGRRGAWLIPLSGPLPWTAGKPTPPVWSAPTLTPATSGGGALLTVASMADTAPSSSATLRSSPGPAPPSSATAASATPASPASRRSPRTIAWTDLRLRACWFWLSRLHETGKMGPVWAECLSSTQTGGLLPDHIRVHAMAHLALALRHYLGLVDVRSTKWREEGAAEDGERFLHKVRLVWVDEGGRGVLVA